MLVVRVIQLELFLISFTNIVFLADKLANLCIGLLNIDNVKDIEQNNFFDKLVLPNGEKNLILALVEEQMRSKSQFDDSICGKGRGLVILLKGPSGVGKTFTAESIAEKLNLPLFSIDQTEILDIRLEDLANDFSNAWNGIFLLEKTEILLENSTYQLSILPKFIDGELNPSSI